MDEIINTIKRGNEKEKRELDKYRGYFSSKYAKYFLFLESILVALFVLSSAYGVIFSDNYASYMGFVFLIEAYMVLICVSIFIIPYMIHCLIKNEQMDIMWAKVKVSRYIVDDLMKFSENDLWIAYQFFSLEVSQIEKRIPSFSLNKLYIFIIYVSSIAVFGLVYAKINLFNIESMIKINDTDIKILSAILLALLISLLASLMRVQKMRSHTFTLKVALVLKKGGDLPLDMGKMVDPTFS